MMGSPDDEAGRRANEIRSEATLDEGFWMARTEVTQRQWKSVMGTRPSDNMGDVSADAILKRAFSVSWSNPYASDADADDLPVECVSWKECQEFCRLTGLQLPTETQWEYACRAGSDGPFAGTGVADQMGWFQGNGRFETHPVGRKRPNAWGLYDMHGNVAEWCEDEWWKGGGGDHPCGVRGGSYWYSEDEGRSARRCKVEARKRYPWLGFRPLFAGAEPPVVAGLREEAAAGGAGCGDL
jgi:formylglycine-generating enzyme required for sulfatase activity